MRRTLFALVLLAACQLTAPNGETVANSAGMAGGGIAVTTLDAAPTAQASVSGEPSAPPVTTASGATPRPKPRPTSVTTAAAQTAEQSTVAQSTAAPEPEAPKSAEQVLCEKTGGQWGAAGTTGTFICLKKTRDAGKVCNKKGDCQGVCLARSGTCAPYAPLYGCNDIFEADGRRVTLCLN
ncbi:MAG: hypothetical protein ABI832_11100 [bacterium]